MRGIALVWLIVVMALAPAPTSAQGPPGGDRREALEEQVRGRFLRLVAERAGLTDAQRREVREVLEEGVQERRDLARASRAVRRDLMQAIRDEDTPMATYESLLERIETVRAREHALQREEEERLEAILDPRQRALFMVLRLQLNERIRRLQGGGRPGGPGGGPGGGPPGS